MLLLEREMKVVRDVAITMPDGNRSTIRVEFLILRNDQLNAIQAPALASLPVKRDQETAESLDARLWAHMEAVTKVPFNLMNEAIIGWPEDAGIMDGSGAPIPYSETAKSLLLSHEFIVQALMNTYRKMINPYQKY